MGKIIKNNYKFILGTIVGIILSITSVYAVEAYIESNKVSYDNKHTKKYNVQDAIDELYERSGMHKEKWVDKELNGADPVLKDPLIPVEIKSNGDVYYANLNSEWYNYKEKRWANAVILIDNPSNQNYKAGDHILESDIESYFVWIPRYQYKIWDMGEYTNTIDAATLNNSSYETAFIQAINKPRIIDIKFGNVESTPKMNESDARLNEYYTHPAFTLGEKNLNGIWVGKFETGYKGATTTVQSQVNREEPNSVVIKPNVYSWNKMTFKNAFMTAYNYKGNANAHNTDLDSHMMKNTEWGAVAYLSHSVYGLGCEIKMNNSRSVITGSAIAENTDLDFSGAADASQIKPYNSGAGYLANTAGNISGIYDMSGGIGDFVASCVDGAVGKSEFSLSELEQYTDLGYIDKYNSNSSTKTFNNRILGDATGELGPFYSYFTSAGKFVRSNWYSDFALFISNDMPFFHRGGGTVQGNIAGVFYFGASNGDGNGIGFRIVLAPNN